MDLGLNPEDVIDSRGLVGTFTSYRVWKKWWLGLSEASFPTLTAYQLSSYAADAVSLRTIVRAVNLQRKTFVKDLGSNHLIITASWDSMEKNKYGWRRHRERTCGVVSLFRGWSVRDEGLRQKGAFTQLAFHDDQTTKYLVTRLRRFSRQSCRTVQGYFSFAGYGSKRHNHGRSCTWCVPSWRL